MRDSYVAAARNTAFKREIDRELNRGRRRIAGREVCRSDSAGAAGLAEGLGSWNLRFDVGKTVRNIFVADGLLVAQVEARRALVAQSILEHDAVGDRVSVEHAA